MSHAHSPWYHSAAIVKLPDGREFFVDSVSESVTDHEIGNALCALWFFAGMESVAQMSPTLVPAPERRGHYELSGWTDP